MKRKADNWGNSDKASKERMRAYNKDKDDQKFDREQRAWERVVMASAAHPAECPICMVRLQSHLLIEGLPHEEHRGHGVCRDCVAGCIMQPCPICRGMVVGYLEVGVEFFGGHPMFEPQE